jgi:hypothetical protein
VAPMTERRSSGGGARARRSSRGWVFIDTGGRLGGPEGNHVAGARAHGQQGAETCGGPAAQWRAAVGTPASGKQPPGTVQATTDITHSSSPARRMDRWVLWCLSVRARCAYGGLAWRTRDVARERALASWVKNSSLMPCSKLFFSGFLN